MWKRSITLRLTLLFAAGAATLLLAMGYAVGVALERHFEQQDLMQLAPELEFALGTVSGLQSQEQLDALPNMLRRASVEHADLSIVVASADGKRIAGTDGFDYPAALLHTGFSADKPAKWREDSRVFRGVAAATSTRIEGLPSALVAVVMDIGPHEAFMYEFERDLWLAVALSIAATLILGWAAARWGLAPLRSMTALAQRITASRLQERLPPDAVPIELKELANAFNAMLARLEDSFRRLSDFSSDLAHELRTPVASLVTHTEVALSRARTAEEYREVLYSNLDMLEHIARMTSDMLYLAKADNGLIVPNKEAVELDAEARGLIDFYGALAEEQDVRLALRGQASVQGDKLMIRRAISNLLSNAIRHAAKGTEVAVEISRTSAREVCVEIRNSGPDIAPEHLTRLFERFYRGAASPESRSEGAGLGLPITKAIAQAHAGRILASSEGGVTRFTLVFPC